MVEYEGNLIPFMFQLLFNINLKLYNMEQQIDYTIEYLEKQLKATEHFKDIPINTKTLGRFLCGENWKLIRYPFSAEFLTNVAFNGPESMHAILLVQLVSFDDKELFI